MNNNFSYVDVQLIWQLMSVSSDEEIATMLERPVSEVKEKILELTGGQPSPYTAALKKKEVKVHNQRVNKNNKLQAKEESDKSKAIKKLIQQQESDRRRKNEVRDAKFKTKTVDYSQMVMVRMDEKTYIYINPGEDITEARMKYFDREREKKNKMIEQKTWKPVAKFR